MSAVASLTSLQYALMDLVAHSEYNALNGGTPEAHTDVDVWFFPDLLARDMGVHEQAVGGVVTSLTQAGLLGVNIVKGLRARQQHESTVWFTEEGFAAWAAHRAAQGPSGQVEAPEAAEQASAAPEAPSFVKLDRAQLPAAGTPEREAYRKARRSAARLARKG